MSREVYIKTEHGTHLVCYIHRRKHQRHFAAQFSESMKTRDQVAQWIDEQTDLQLINLPERRLERKGAAKPFKVGQKLTLAFWAPGKQVEVLGIRRDTKYAGGIKVKIVKPGKESAVFSNPSWVSIQWFAEAAK
jgi:hypothetical protein